MTTTASPTTTGSPTTMSAFLDHDMLGECPYWLPDRGLLSRVDIHGGDVVLLDPVTGVHERHHVGSPVAFAVPRTGGGFVAGIGMTITLLDADFQATPLVDIGPERDTNRFNDAVCDAQGRLWAGTMSAKRPRDLGTGEAALYRFDPDGSYEEVLSGLTLSNGMDFVDDGRTMLHIDSDAHRIDRYCVDVEKGRISDRHTVVEFDAELGLPDGMTVDAEGGMWLAFFGSGQVRRYDASGTEQIRYTLPVSCPASVILGGEDLRDLFVTTSSHRLTEEEARVQSLAGSVLRIRVDVPGLPQHSFAG
jgi:sugar lactone lactonase YvrE